MHLLQHLLARFYIFADGRGATGLQLQWCWSGGGCAGQGVANQPRQPWCIVHGPAPSRAMVLLWMMPRWQLTCMPCSTCSWPLSKAPADTHKLAWPCGHAFPVRERPSWGCLHHKQLLCTHNFSTPCISWCVLAVCGCQACHRQSGQSSIRLRMLLQHVLITCIIAHGVEGLLAWMA